MSKTPDESWHVTRLAGALAAEVRGIDLSRTKPADIDGIKSLLNEHQVLFFPELELPEKCIFEIMEIMERL